MGVIAGVLNLFSSQLTDAFGDSMGTVITVLGWVCALVAAVGVYQGVVHAADEQDWYAEGEPGASDEGYDRYDDRDGHAPYDDYDEYDDTYDEYDDYGDDRAPEYAEQGAADRDHVPYPGWDETLPPAPRESDPWAGRTYADEHPIDGPDSDPAWYAPGSDRASRDADDADDPWGETRPSAPEWRER